MQFLVSEQELPRGPQPEAAIENGPCRERLLRHIQRCQAIIDARLDSIEAQVAGELRNLIKYIIHIAFELIQK